MPSPVEQRVVASLVAVAFVGAAAGVVALASEWDRLVGKFEWLAKELGMIDDPDWWKIGRRRAPRWLHAFLLYMGLTMECDGTRCSRCG